MDEAPTHRSSDGVDGVECPAYDHGFIVQSAAEKRLTLASAAVHGGPRLKIGSQTAILDSRTSSECEWVNAMRGGEHAAQRDVAHKAVPRQVWLVRHTAPEEAGGPDETILSSLVSYQDGVQVTHYKVCANAKNRRFLLHPDGERAECDFESIDQLLTAYKIPEGMPNPAPLGIYVPRDATEIWSGDKRDESPSRESSSARETRLAYKCELCGLVEGTVEPFIEHVRRHTAEEREISATLRLESGDQSMVATGVHMHVILGKGKLVGGATEGCFVRIYRAGREYFQSAIVLEAGDSTEWKETTFVPVHPGGSNLAQPIRVELCARSSEGVENAVAIGEISVHTLEFGEPREVELLLDSLMDDGQSKTHQSDRTLIKLVVVLSRRDMTPPWKFSPLTWPPDDSICRQLTPRYHQLRSKKKADDAKTLPAQLISRLEKLLYGCPVGGDRKAFERSVVEWVKDTLVKKCPDCGEGFGITRRRHHCRLCGGVVCHGCSVTLDTIESAEMVREVRQVHGDSAYPDAKVTSDVAIRSCSNCVKVAERAHGAAMKSAQLKAHRTSTQVQMAQAVSYYDVLMAGKKQLLEDWGLYRELGIRLQRHEGLDSAAEVSTLYSKIIEDISMLDKVSKKIITFSTGMDFVVFENVRELCVSSVGRLVNRLPSLPSEEGIRAAIAEKARRRSAGAAALVAAGGKLFELWEVQRWHHTLWFTPSALTEADWQPWSSGDGSWGYFSRTAVNAPSASAWIGEWFQHPTGGDMDGWQYSDSFTSDPTNWSPTYDRVVHRVRRRRWYRAHGERRSMTTPETGRAGKPTRKSTRHQTPDPESVDGTEAWRQAGAGPHSPSSTDVDGADDGESDPSDDEDEDDGNTSIKATWIKDSATKQCMLCTTTFTKRRRRHHCRHCGRVVCGKCSGHRTPHAEYRKKKGVRTCDQCCAFQKQQNS